MLKHFLSILIVVVSALSLTACSCTMKKKEQRVGVDPSWYPLDLPQRYPNITAFSTDILKGIGKIEHIPFIKVTMSWDNLMSGLKKGEYEAILSSMPPYIFNEKIFDFSQVYLPLGPVLVVPANSPITSIKGLDGKRIATLPDTEGALILETQPNILIIPYDSIPNALADIVNETIDGALIDILTASAYCEDIYHGQLKVATPPLNDAGLRLITLHNQDPTLITSFNKGLTQLKRSGEYDKLLSKWGLLSPPPR